MKSMVRKALSAIIMCVSVSLISILAVPMYLFLGPITVIWTAADAALHKLE